MDEIKLGIAQHRGIRAQELLENSLLKEAFQDLEKNYLEAWLSTKTLETAHREKWWLAIQILRKIQEHLTLHVTNGRVAAADLRRLSEESQRRK